MKKTIYRFGLATIAALVLGAGFFACENPAGGGGNRSETEFVPVEGITLSETRWVKGTEIDLNALAVLSPPTASVNTIEWAVTNGSTTGVATGLVEDGKVTPAAAGTLTLAARIAGGGVDGEDYIESGLTIEVTNAFVAVTGIDWTSPAGTAGVALDLSGVTVRPDNSTNQNIVWSVAGDSEIAAANVTISGTSKTAVITPAQAGQLRLTATIANGLAQGSPYSASFTIPIAAQFVAVTSIDNVPSTAYVNVELNLSSAAVHPDEATHKDIIWTVKDAGGTGLTNDGIVDNKFTPASAGTLELTATITDGLAEGEDFTCNFTITVNAVDNRQPLEGTVSITGNAVKGESLSAANVADTLSNEEGTPSYVWQRGDSQSIQWAEANNIAGATGATYALVDADAGKWIRVIVSYSGNTGVKESAAVGPVVWAAISGKPAINGSLTVGSVLTAGDGTMSGLNANGTRSYQWQRSDTSAFDSPADIDGNLSTYTLVDADQGKYIRVSVSNTKNSNTVTSEAAGPVAWAALGGTVSLSGTPTVGQNLTANTGSITKHPSATLSYQWQRSGASAFSGTTNIGGNSSAYTLTEADQGNYVRVVVSSDKNTGTVASAGSAQVTWPAISGKPVISGTLKTGEVLTAGNGTMNGLNTSGTSSYQWQRAATSGGAFENIGSGTGQTYTVTQSDETKYLRVAVSNTKNSNTALSDAVYISAPDLGDAPVFTGSADDLSMVFGAGDINAVAWGNGTFVAGGGTDGKIGYSPDGKAWTPTTVGWSTTGIKSIAFGNNTFIAVGAGSAMSGSTNNGVTWSRVSTTSNTGFNGGSGIGVVAFGNNTFVAADYQSSTTSYLTGTWTSTTEWTGGSNMGGPTGGGNGAAWTGSQFVMVGVGGAIVTSADGTSWTTRRAYSADNAALNAVAATEGTIVAVGAGGTILSSPDGITWTARTSSVTGSLNAVVWAGNRFFAAGAGGKIIYSADGITWSSANCGAATADFKGLAWNGSCLVAVGAGGTVYTYGTMADTTPPAEVSGLGSKSGNGEVTITWTDPKVTDLDHIEVTWEPGGSTTQIVAKGTQTYTATNLTNKTEYTFTVKSVDRTGNKSDGVSVRATPTDSASVTICTNITEVQTFLQTAEGGTSVDTAISLVIGSGFSGTWAQLLTAINDAKKYVNLDLSASNCGVSSGKFNPESGTSTGKTYIVSIVLPNSATSIPAGTQPNGTFKYFTNLQSISGAEVTSIGMWGFYHAGSTGLAKLETADFPKVTSIGTSVFARASSLKTLNIPSIQSIDTYAFQYTGATALTITMDKTAPATLGTSMFSGVSSSKTVTVKVPYDATGYVTSNDKSENWGNAFRGGGSSSFNSNNVNTNITLIVDTKK